jgi:hypothetical protein
VPRILGTMLVSCVLLLAGWVGAPAASACSCALTGTAEHYAGADTVSTGRLTSREVLHPAGPTVVSAESGASCGLELTGNGPFLVFAARDDGGVLRADLCGGTAPLTAELAAEVEALGGSAAPPSPGTSDVAGPIDPAMEDDSAPRSTALAREIGAALLALVAGILVVRSRRRARRVTMVLLTRS